MIRNNVLEPVAVERDDALTDQLEGNLLQRGMHSLVLGLRSEQNEALGVIVGLQSVDVMHHLARPSLQHDSVHWNVGLAPRDRIAGPVDSQWGEFGPALVGVERVTMQLPLLPVSRAEAPGDCRPVTVGTLRLWRPVSQAPGTVAILLVVLQAHALGLAQAVAAFNHAWLSHGSHATRNFENNGNATTRTRQYEQVGNAVPPLLAVAVLGVATGIDWLPVAERYAQALYGHREAA